MLQADLAGSGFYRITEPAAAAIDRDSSLTVVAGPDITASYRSALDGEIRIVELITTPDVLVIQRPLRQSMHEVALAAKRQGIKIVVDIDDDFHNIHADNIAYAAVDPKHDPWHNKGWLLKTCALADVITVSTPALLKYATGKTRGVVVRNRVPARALNIHIRSRPNAVGWTGTTRTHPADLQRARGVMRNHDLPFRVVGDATGVSAAIGCPRVELASPWLDSVDDYWRAIARAFSVGIAPLEPSKFNKAKSALKGYEYCALGIPFIASPTPEYRMLAKDSGAGLIADGAGQWASRTADVLCDYDRMAGRAREWAEANTLEQHVDEWIAAWTMAAEAK